MSSLPFCHCGYGVVKMGQHAEHHYAVVGTEKCVALDVAEYESCFAGGGIFLMGFVEHSRGYVICVDPAIAGQAFCVIWQEDACPGAAVKDYVVGFYLCFIEYVVDDSGVDSEHVVPFFCHPVKIVGCIHLAGFVILYNI